MNYSTELYSKDLEERVQELESAMAEALNYIKENDYLVIEHVQEILEEVQ
jgi:uncharacterized coiled-coil protein SlyX